MSKSDILAKLKDLHEELASISDDQEFAGQVNDETIDALGQLVSDAGSILNRLKEENPDRENVLAEQNDLMDRVMKFETDHPRVAGLLNQVTDVLAMMGI